MTSFVAAAISWLTLHWRLTMTAFALSVAASFKRLVESDDARAQRLRHEEKKRLRQLAENIASYACKVHQRYPTGDVIVSQRDLAEQLRKTPSSVSTALNLLLEEQKVQRASLPGYWKLNV
ncbi:MAG: hypothetical protein JO249_21850 [Acidobacteria bacterium]|nr:hypothetical protein [Acidobacteriota bacterium]